MEMQKLRPFLLPFIILISVLIFGVFQYSDSWGFVHIKGFNALFLVPFVCLLLLAGAFLAQGKQIFQTTPDVLPKLTKRELEIVKLIKEGKKNQEIAEALFVEMSTVKTHINNIYTKLSIKNRKQLLELIPE